MSALSSKPIPIVHVRQLDYHTLWQMWDNGAFYLQILCVGLGLAVGFLLSTLARIALKRRADNDVGSSIDWSVVKQYTRVFTPFFSIIILDSARAVMERFQQDTSWIAAAVAIAGAWLAARSLRIIMKDSAISWFISALIYGYTLLSVSGLMKSVSEYLGAMAFEVGKFRLSMLGIVHGLIMFVLVFWGANVISHALESYLRRTTRLTYTARELLVKFMKVLVYFIAFGITLDAMGVDLTAFAVFGGALGVGVGLGLQRITANFVSGIVILLEKSVKIGDLVEVGNYTGWVRMLQMRYTLVETFDGREVLVPNEELVSTRLTNWTYSNRHARIEIPLTLVYTADVRLAQTLMLQCAFQHALCLKEPAPSCFLRQFNETGIGMLLSFWIPDIKDGRLKPQSEVMFAILEAFHTHGIAFYTAQPTVMLQSDIVKA